MKEVTYELSSPFTYAKNGEPVEASFVTLKAPSHKQAKHATPIKQAFMKATMQAAKMFSDVSVSNDKEPEKDQDQSGEEVMELMSAFHEDLTPVKMHAEEFFKHDVALIDGEALFTKPLLEKMSFYDFEMMLGTYIASFLVPSPKNTTKNHS